MNNIYPKKQKFIAHKIGATVSYTSKRSRVRAATILASKYKHIQTTSLGSRESKLGYLSTKISNTNLLLDYSSSFGHAFSPKELVLPTSQVTITTTHSKPTLTKHLKNPIEVAKVVEDTKEKSKDEKRKAYFSQGMTLATSFEEKRQSTLKTTK